MKKLNGKSCYPCFVAKALKKKWTKQAWLNHLERRSDKNISQYCLASNGYIPLCATFQGHSGGKKSLIYHCRTMCKSRTIGENTFITVVLDVVAVLLFNQVWLLEGQIQKEDDKPYFFTAVDPMSEPQRGELYDEKEPREVLYRMKWKVHQNAVYWINLKKCWRQRIDILSNEFQRCHPRQLCVSRLSWKNGKSQNQFNLVSKDSFIVTSVTLGYVKSVC